MPLRDYSSSLPKRPHTCFNPWLRPRVPYVAHAVRTDGPGRRLAWQADFSVPVLIEKDILGLQITVSHAVFVAVLDRAYRERALTATAPG